MKTFGFFNVDCAHCFKKDDFHGDCLALIELKTFCELVRAFAMEQQYMA